MVLVDAIARRLPGALAEGSGEHESSPPSSTAGSSTRTTRGRPSFAAGRFPRSSSPAITAASRAGAGSRAASGRPVRVERSVRRNTRDDAPPPREPEAGRGRRASIPSRPRTGPRTTRTLRSVPRGRGTTSRCRGRRNRGSPRRRPRRRRTGRRRTPRRPRGRRGVASRRRVPPPPPQEPPPPRRRGAG